MNKIIVIYKEVGKEPIPMKIENTIQKKEELVGGKIKVMQFENVYICCNEEYQRKTIKPNIAYKFSSICGNFFVTNKDINTDELISLTKQEAKEYYFYLIKNAFSYINCDENGKLLSRTERRRKRQLEKLNMIANKESEPKKYEGINCKNGIKLVEIKEENTNETNENSKLEEKKLNMNNLSNNVENRGKMILEKDDSSSKFEPDNQEILKMILGIQAIIVRYLKTAIPDESDDESEEI